MGNLGRICRSALAPVLVCLVTLVSHTLVFALSLDSERNDHSTVVMASTQRLDDLERDNTDLKPEVKSLDAQTSALPQVIPDSSNRIQKSLPQTRQQLGQYTRAIAPGINKQDKSLAQEGSGGSKKSVPNALKNSVTMCAQSCDAASLQSAYDMTADGGTITIKPGEYPISDDVTFTRSMTIIGYGAHLKSVTKTGSAKIAFIKAPIVAEAARIRVEGLVISNPTSPSGNGACVRGGPNVKLLEVINIKCYGAQMGVLAGLDDGEVLIDGSTIYGTYSNSLIPHVLYISLANKFTLRNSVIHSTPSRPIISNGTRLAGGHLVKTGAKEVLIENNVIAALDTKASRTVDAYAGGKVIIRNNVMQVRNNDNLEFFSYGVEAARLSAPPHDMLVEGNTLIIDDHGERSWSIFRPVLPLVSPFNMVFRNNRIIGMANVAPWVTQENNSVFPNRAMARLPEYDGTLKSIVK